MTARDRILGSIRDGLLRAQLPSAGHGPPAGTTTSLAVPRIDGLVAQFSAALEALAGRVHRARSAAEAAELVAGIARACQAESFMSWDEAAIECPGLLAALQARGLSRVTYDVSVDAERRLSEVNALAGVGLGITGARAALAETGGVVLVNGPGRGRLPSILPPVHVAVVAEQRVRASLADLVREDPRLFAGGSNVVIVAGPSRTADIEMTLTHGVHGPKQLHVVLMA